ncbi:uncharacterized protein LOC115413452 isoform X2 [Sphaeramia orbicularis]|uniref:uncharacterized protein LOC115413452 isoform X2 n=1 Tax=Sphaeramia orbicularis TaxID=375764 RepID=UPI00117E91F3|nr:uncharacterized protein LOC115413452 isoform X2 [Sphaeramia orbicularis]
MKVSVVVVILIHVSQHALAVVVQAYEGMESVLLPYHYSGMFPEVPFSLVWRCSDLNQTVLHLLKYERGNLKEQYSYSERTSMKTNAPQSGDFSLTLKKPQLSDSNNYTCNLQWENEWKETKEDRLTQVELQVKDDEEEAEVQQGVESIQLPCKASADLPEDTTVEWTYFDPQPVVVHVSRNKIDDLQTQDRSYRDRTEMNTDMSLSLKYPTDRDGEGFPTWATALLVVFAVLLIILLGLLYIFRGYFPSAQLVEVDSGEESALLPYKTIAHLTKNSRHISVMWKKADSNQLIVHKYGSGEPDKQDQIYRNRTEMKKHWLRTGDFSLTLKHPTAQDTNEYLCIVYNKNKVLKEKRVVLKVKVQQVEGDSGKESVPLPMKTTLHIEDVSQVTVEWTDNRNRKVHVYEDGSDRTNEQDDEYTNRTEMKEDPLRTGDLSLTLKHPTDQDTGIYTCTVYNRDKQILRRKQVDLKVKGQQVEVEDGAWSALLPFRTTPDLPQDATVVWMRYTNDREYILVHVYEKYAQLNQQDNRYKDRTKMNEDPWTTGDFSLTLNDLQQDDSGRYGCAVIRDGVTLRLKTVDLKVKAQQVEVEVSSGVGSVLLPFKTTLHIEDVSQVTVEWTACCDKKVHMYEDGSDRTNEQDDEYTNRTEMKEDPLRTGDLSLTLKHPTDQDTHIYTCIVYNRDNQILRRKRVYLWVIGQQVEVEEGASSALLPFRTTPDLPQDATVVWLYCTDDRNFIPVHMYRKSALLGQQDDRYKNRTKMNEDPWKTGDLSLTLNDLQQDDFGRYECEVVRGRVPLRRKVLDLKVKVQCSDAGQRSFVSPSSVSSADRSQITYQFPPIREDEAEAAV